MNTAQSPWDEKGGALLYLVHLLNRPVDDSDGVQLGWVEDLVLRDAGGLIPRVESLVLASRGHGAMLIPWEAIAEVNRRGDVRLNVTRDSLSPSPVPEEVIFLRRDILDKQIVDVSGRRVVRVNDLQLAKTPDGLRLVGADIGARGLLRRLSLERPVRSLAHVFHLTLPHRVIPWQYVAGLESEWSSVKLNVEYRRLKELPPPDLADILAQLDRLGRDELVHQMDDETLAEALPHMEDDLQAEVITGMSDVRASDIMEMLPPDEAADVLGDLTDEHSERILRLMEPEEAEDVRELLQYEDDTAGGLMTTEYVALTAGISTEEALASLREMAPDAETIYYIYVTDAEGHLEGVISLRDLITAAPTTLVDVHTRRDVVYGKVSDDQEAVARLLTKYGLLAVPIVDEENILRGIVTVDDVLDVMVEEAEEDEARLSGAVDEGDDLATTIEQAVGRFPWALVAAAAGCGVALLLTASPIAQQSISVLIVIALLLLPGVHLGSQAAAMTKVMIAEEDDLSAALQGHLRLLWPMGVGLATVVTLAAMLFSLALFGTGVMIGVARGVIPVMLIDLLAGAILPYLLYRLHWDPTLVNRPAIAALTILTAVFLLQGV